jgi:hypothetical protein
MSFNRFKKRKNKFNSLIKHLFLGKGLQDRKIIFGRAKGIHLYIDPAFNFQRITGAYEYEVQNLFVDFARKTDCFLDLGAGDGYYSLLYKKYNPAKEVYLFDADEGLEQLQKKHFALNNIPGGFHLYFKTLADGNAGQEISGISPAIGNNKTLIKIDVEGAELLALKALSGLLKENECWLIIETHSAQLEKDCIDFLTKYNYNTRVIKNAWWRSILPERRPLEHNRWLAAWK